MLAKYTVNLINFENAKLSHYSQDSNVSLFHLDDTILFVVMITTLQLASLYR